MCDIKQDLKDYELHCLQGEQFQVAELIQNAIAKVQELEGLVAKAYHSESLVREYKADAIDEFIESQKTPEGRYPMLIKLKALIDWRAKLRESKDDQSDS